ncbi:MAG: CcmD family protein [bacterium]
MLFAYMFSISRRQKNLEQEINQIRSEREGI